MSDEHDPRFRIGFWLFPLPLILYRPSRNEDGARGEREEEGGAACPDPLDLLGALVPRDVRRHLDAARVELLKAARAAIDGRIEAIERRGRPKRRAEKVPVEEED